MKIIIVSYIQVSHKFHDYHLKWLKIETVKLGKQQVHKFLYFFSILQVVVTRITYLLFSLLVAVAGLVI